VAVEGGGAEELVRPLSDRERLAEFMRRLAVAGASKQVRGEVGVKLRVLGVTGQASGPAS
jgi:hypothetical protein